MSRLRILPYKMGSAGARDLARELGCKRIQTQGSKFIQHSSDVVINWGNSTPQFNRHGQSIIPSLNVYAAVASAANKLKTLNKFREAGVSYPSYCTTYDAAKIAIEQGHKVYCRTQLTGCSGAGIIVATSVDELVDAPLYTKKVNSGKEYRVHVFRGEILDYAKKGRKRVDGEESRPSGDIRSYSKGWVFIREGIELPEAVKRESIKAVEALGLDFGAVDICTIKNTNDEQVCVFEVNCAPGLSGQTLHSYKNAILNYIRERR